MDQGQSVPGRSIRHRSLTFALFLASGFTGLVYEVLWMKELGLLFGNTTLAAATTLTAFFLGLAVGGYVWGRRAGRMRQPLRTYAILEGCIALSALLYFLLLDAYHALYAPLFNQFGSQPTLLIAVKFALALSALFPPSFFMGGTLPVMSQHLVQHATALGRTTSALYAVNTSGAALGAFVAGFFLPPWLGFTKAYLVAVITTSLIAVAAWYWSKEAINPPDVSVVESDVASATPLLSSHAMQWLAFLSGFVALSLQVLWTRMFAQVLQNSVYTYSLILTTVLIALALGAGVAHGTMHLRARPLNIFCGLLAAAAFLSGLSPFVFTWLTDGLSYVGGSDNWAAYIGRVFGLVGVVIGLPSIFLGCVLPYLFKLSQPFSPASSTGQTIGSLVAMNTIGAIAGSLCAGFVFLEWFGLWASIRLVAASYFIAMLLIMPRAHSPRLVTRIIPASGLLLLLSFLDPSHLPQVRVQPLKRQESLYDVWEGSGATVAVVKRKSSLKLKVNNIYTVGGSGAAIFEARQAHIPLTMLEVYPLVTWWRGDFFAVRPIVLLVGHREAESFEPHDLSFVDDVPFLAYYAGNLTRVQSRFDRYPVNTDDRPIVEYRAPITHRRRRAKRLTWFVGEPLLTFMETVLHTIPPEHDTYLQNLPTRQHAYVQAGLHRHWASVLKKAGKVMAAEEAQARYFRLLDRY
ncbi:fused MFS/spermidine synthase [Candidatus Entotheonella palauensis]|uniref:fused MFS/spermidine synthase n=1 Tax=Candidatus Entotheonella palauensis TaxID=93172 RepID=UPI00117896BA|nr:fused MFS/spermidine synthase [Candidatus Entotheonella palauensis]